MIVCAPVLALIVLAFSRTKLIDDAYISFRYAHNLVQGHGLVFNRGEYVEGFTNLLWTLLMVVPELLGIPVDLAAFWLGIGFAALALRDVAQLTGLLRVSGGGTVAAVLALALFPSFWRAAANGLETGLLAFLLTRTICFVLMQRWVAASVCCGLLFVTRPDTLMVLPLAILWQLTKLPGPTFRNVNSWKKHALLLAPWALIVSGVTVWRLWYYDAWLPNTLIAKSWPLAFSRQTLHLAYWSAWAGLRYWFDFLLAALPLTTGALLAMTLNPRRSEVWLCIAVVTAQLPVVLINGGDWMPNQRLLAPYAPLLAALVGLGLDRARHWEYVPSSPWRLGIPALVPVIMAGTLIVALRAADQWSDRPRLVPGRPAPCWQTLARLLGPVLRPSDRMSPEALGIFGYRLPNVYMHDFLGLTDRHVARYGSSYVRHYGKLNPEYTYRTIRPDVIIVHSRMAHLTTIAAASGGSFNETYSTYSLDKVGSCSDGVLMSVRKSVEKRMLTAFAGIELTRVLVPSEPDTGAGMLQGPTLGDVAGAASVSRAGTMTTLSVGLQ